MEGTEFLTLAKSAEAETRVKGSTFIALAAPALSEEAARVVLAIVQKKHFAATHNCSAWRLRGGVWRANDAGEPSGSAGAPILSAIDGAGLTDCVIVVTRYYGGTKLGVGGLVRAYSEVAALALAGSSRLLAIPAARLRIRFPYEHTSAVMRLLERAGTAEPEHGYSGGGAEGEVSFTLPCSDVGEVRDQLRETTGGLLTPEHLEDRVLYRPAPANLS
jgi:putative IMPACT (imprinted ancient) family translation regulator